MKKLGPISSLCAGATVAWLVISVLDCVAAVVLDWHRPAWVLPCVGALEGAAAVLVGLHFMQRAESRDAASKERS